MWIKIILALPLLVVILFLFKNIQSKTTYRLLLMLIAGTGIVFIINPDLTTTIANKLNVGRGTDLISYLFFNFFFIVLILFYNKMRKLEAVQTDIIRLMAIQNANKITKQQDYDESK